MMFAKRALAGAVRLASLALIFCLLSTRAAAQDSSVTDLMNRAYGLLPSRPDEAARLFAQVVAADPSNTAARNQLGYIYLAQEKPRDALEQFQASDAVRPSDTLRLQIAYTLGLLDRAGEAAGILRKLRESDDPWIRQKAAEALAVSPPGERSRRYVRFYADPYYDTRWDDFFFQFNFQSGYHLTQDQNVTAYGVLALSTDSRSSTGIVPQIISDNALLVGAGLRVKPLYGLSLFVQEGVAFDLIRHGSEGDPKNDFRAVAVYGNGIYPPVSVHPGVRSPFAPFADLYGSFGYYSRYKDAIGYLQGRAGVRAFEVDHTAADVYLRGDFVIDTEREFYDNLVEGGAGISLMPNVDWGLRLTAEYHRGQYLNVSAAAEQQRAALYDQGYNSFRFFIIVEKIF